MVRLLHSVIFFYRSLFSLIISLEEQEILHVGSQTHMNKESLLVGATGTMKYQLSEVYALAFCFLFVDWPDHSWIHLWETRAYILPCILSRKPLEVTLDARMVSLMEFAPLSMVLVATQAKKHATWLRCIWLYPSYPKRLNACSREHLSLICFMSIPSSINFKTIYVQERARISRARERRNDAKNTVTTEYVFERGNEISSRETKTRKVCQSFLPACR